MCIPRCSDCLNLIAVTSVFPAAGLSPRFSLFRNFLELLDTHLDIDRGASYTTCISGGCISNQRLSGLPPSRMNQRQIQRDNKSPSLNCTPPSPTRHFHHLYTFTILPQLLLFLLHTYLLGSNGDQVCRSRFPNPALHSAAIRKPEMGSPISSGEFLISI